MSARKSLHSMGSYRSAEWNPAPGWSWEPYDLADYAEEGVDGSLIPPPSQELFVRSDGAGLLYAGRTHDLHGPPESGKSWAAMLAVRDVLLRGDRALFCDYEDCGPEEIMDRCRRLGVPMDLILSGLTYVQPREAPSGKQWEDLVYRNYGVAVIDAVTGALAEMDRDGNSNSDVAVWAKSTVHPLAQGGTPVIVVDHTPLGANRVLGAITKKGTLTGVSYRVVASVPMVPGAIGVIELHVVKDRAGYVRAASGPRRKDNSQHTASITFDATDPMALEVSIDPPGQAIHTEAGVGFSADQLDSLRERLSRFVETAAAPPSQNALAKAGLCRRGAALEQITYLVEKGCIAPDQGPRRSIVYRHVRPYESEKSGRS